MDSLGAKAHAEAGQVSVGEGEEDHEDNEPGIMFKEHGQVVAWLNITQHEERHKGNTGQQHHRQEFTVLSRLVVRNIVSKGNGIQN